MFIKPVTARLGTRVGLVVGLDILVTILVPLVLFSLIYTLPDCSLLLFLRSDIGIVLTAVISVLLICLFFVVFWLLFSTGKIVVDSSGIRWKLKDTQGEILWEKPFTVRRWQSVYVSGGYTYDNNPVSLPAVVYEITQGDRRITFWYSESSKKTEGLPSGPLYGVPLLHNARKIASAIDRIYDGK